MTHYNMPLIANILRWSDQGRSDDVINYDVIFQRGGNILVADKYPDLLSELILFYRPGSESILSYFCMLTHGISPTFLAMAFSG